MLGCVESCDTCAGPPVLIRIWDTLVGGSGLGLGPGVGPGVGLALQVCFTNNIA